MDSMSDDKGFYTNTPPAIFETTEAYDAGETDFYHRLAQDHPGRILELGCGTGQHLRRLAGKGHTVFGLELVPALAEAAQQAAATEGRGWTTQPRFITGDMRSFAIDEKFALIFITCGSFYHLLSADEQIATLTCARRHLGSDGAICVASEIPCLKTWTWDKGPDYRLIHRTERRCQVGERSFIVCGIRNYNPVTQMCSIDETIYEEAEVEVVVDRRAGQFRFTTPNEMDLICGLSGLKMVRRYPGLDTAAICALAIGVESSSSLASAM